ncbi:hypothetical protein HMPREF1544_00162 [Mucor circinelloides 1006PhL]|uniref:Uncharacterized protein n=1 Tax=Mucor circinelloides f. circinelloides (strain 1006PhL) TaxID=1220926 RepID=S2KC54_MUCC1|nr:hypothetical protein HMPREF1544_00162 [Mucor circinelloides 1006PhL]
MFVRPLMKISAIPSCSPFYKTCGGRLLCGSFLEFNEASVVCIQARIIYRYIVLVIKIAWLHCKSSFLRRGGTLIIGLLSIPGFNGTSAIIVGLVGRIRGTDGSNANRPARDNTTNTEERLLTRKFNKENIISGSKRQLSTAKPVSPLLYQTLSLLAVASFYSVLLCLYTLCALKVLWQVCIVNVWLP